MLYFKGEKLFRELELAKEERKLVERQREELVRKAKQMQNKTQNRRNHGMCKMVITGKQSNQIHMYKHTSLCGSK